MNIGDLPKGIYCLNFYFGENIIVRKVIKN
ncbi:MAG: hypothetical protein J6P97_06550 [Bacteroidales bacterium]|nr:hypothetical protein [Bacteroidales bacterium]